MNSYDKILKSRINLMIDFPFFGVLALGFGLIEEDLAYSQSVRNSTYKRIRLDKYNIHKTTRRESNYRLKTISQYNITASGFSKVKNQ